MIPAVEGDGGLGVEDDADEVFAEGGVAGGCGLGAGAAAAGGHEEAEGLGGGGEVEFRGDDFEEFRDSGLGVSEELGAGTPR